MISSFLHKSVCGCILIISCFFIIFFFFIVPAPTEIYTLSLHDALPISRTRSLAVNLSTCRRSARVTQVSRRRNGRSEEHTSELQSRFELVCRLLLEKKKYVLHHVFADRQNKSVSEYG